MAFSRISCHNLPPHFPPLFAGDIFLSGSWTSSIHTGGCSSIFLDTYPNCLESRRRMGVRTRTMEERFVLKMSGIVPERGDGDGAMRAEIRNPIKHPRLGTLLVFEQGMD